MMNVSYEIFKILSKEVASQISLSPQMNEGLSAYVADNGLSDLLERTPAAKRGYCLEMFMKPILSLPANEAVLFFETYTLRQTFSRTVNLIHSEAEKKFIDRSYTCEGLSGLSDKFTSLVKELYRHPGFQTKYAFKVSDCIVDLDFLAGASDNVSHELMRRLAPITEPNEGGGNIC